MRKMMKEHEEKQQKSTVKEPEQGAVPAYLLDRQKQTTGAILSNAIKQKRKEKAVSLIFPTPLLLHMSSSRANTMFLFPKSRLSVMQRLSKSSKLARPEERDGSEW